MLISRFLMIWVSIVVLGLVYHPLKAGVYEISKIDSSDGLPSDNVKEIFQDSKGYIWFGTTEGLIRYDGYELKEYSIANYHNRGLITNLFNAIDEDSNGNLWCATDRGVACLDVSTETFRFFNMQSPEPFKLQIDVINALKIDDNDRVWIGTAGSGVEVFIPNQGIVERYNLSKENTGMNSDWITNIYVDHQNNIWISSWKGALTYINQEKNIIKSWTKGDISLDIPYFSPYCIIEDSMGDYWLGLWEGGLVKFGLSSDSMIIKKHLLPNSIKPSITSNIIFDLAIDHYNNLWVGTPNGLSLISDPDINQPAFQQFKYEQSGHHISHDEAYTLLCDASGLLWVGTAGGGVNKIDDKIKLFTSYPLPDVSPNFKSQSVTAFTIDFQGNLLIGVKSLGFGCYNIENETFIKYTELPAYNKLPDDINTVNCFLWDDNGCLWLGTRYMGLIKYDPRRGKFLIINKDVTKYDFAAREISDIHKDHLGNIWVGTENGLYKIIHFESESFDGFNILHYKYEADNAHSLSSNRISKILEDRNQTLWVATYDHGINKLTSNIRTHFPLIFERILATNKENNGLITDNILTLFEDAEYNLWIGSGGGSLFRRNGTDGKYISYGFHVSGNIIYNIEQDLDGYLWVSTNRGLTRIMDQDSTVRSYYFLQENGLQSNIFNKGASFKDSEGHIYFGGNSGFNYFNPQAIQTGNYIPPVVITDLRVMSQPVHAITSAMSPLVLNHLKNNFSVTFSALSYSQPENNKYTVCLEGLETEWRILNADTRTLNYSNLKPGNYVLKVRGANSHGYWNPQAKELFIKVNAAPYKTWWAFVLYALMFGGIIMLFFRMERKNQQVKYALDIEHIERGKSDNLNLFKQGLFANISHEFLTPLSILSCLIDDWKHLRSAPNNKDLSLAERNINRLNRLNQQFLYYSKAEVKQLPLSVIRRNLNEFVQHICDNFSPLARKKQIYFNYEISFPDTDVWFDPEKLDIILYNLLSNAFKFTGSGGEVLLSLSINPEKTRTEAMFVVKDTGVGMDDEQLNNLFNRYSKSQRNNNQNQGFGIGLSLTKSMVEAHNGSIKIQSKVSEGTMVMFALPVNRKAFNDSEIVDALQSQFSFNSFSTEDIEEETILRIKNLNQTFKDKPTVLLVDDYTDFRKLLRNSLEEFFIVLESNNGVTAFEMVVNKRVNLVISDVVMPTMSGIELCEKIKGHEATSHIPVILLTAKSEDADRAAGYRAGADSYISKPFNLNTLLTRIEALLEQKKRVEARLINKKSIEGYNPDNKINNDMILSRVREFIELNISNPELSVKMVSKELSISNSMLYRKTSELLNINPNTLIRKLRMIKAIELLEEDDQSISEVAYQCGFKDVSYFGAMFKKEYGVTPSQYQHKGNG